MMRLIVILFLSIEVFSCGPSSYPYHASTQRISHPIDSQDSIFIFFPYARFALVGRDNKVLDKDSILGRAIEEISNDYLLRIFQKKFKSSQLRIENSDRDSLGYKFGKMTRNFFEKKENKYTLQVNHKKNGYGLIFGSDWQLWDYLFWRSLHHSGKGSSWDEPRLNTLNYFCLIDLQTGTVLDYKYLYKGFYLDTFRPSDYPRIVVSNPAETRSFNSEGNRSIEEQKFRKIVEQNLDQVSKHLLR